MTIEFESSPIFEVREKSGKIYRIFSDGHVEGFEDGCLAINMIPATMWALRTADKRDAAVRSNVGLAAANGQMFRDWFDDKTAEYQMQGYSIKDAKERAMSDWHTYEAADADEINRLRETLQTIRLATCDYTVGTRASLEAAHKLATDALKTAQRLN